MDKTLSTKDMILSRLETSLNLTDDLAGLEPTGIPDLPKTNKVSGRKPRIIAQTMSGNYQVISCGTKVTLDPVMKKIGIWIPEMLLNDDILVNLATSSLQIFIQINGAETKQIVCFDAKIRKDHNDKNVLNRQFVNLVAMIHAGSTTVRGVSSLVDDVKQGYTFDDPLLLQERFPILAGSNLCIHFQSA